MATIITANQECPCNKGASINEQSNQLHIIFVVFL